MGGLWFQVAQFALLSLVAYRLQRIVTADSWPPTKWFREKLETTYGEESHTYTLFTCPWCYGFWVTVAVFSWACYLVSVRWPVAQTIAASVVVGKLGRDD
jgi:hypothetical protein